MAVEKRNIIIKLDGLYVAIFTKFAGMKIAVLAFGVAKEMVGGSSTVLEMTDGDTVADIKAALESSHPRLMQLSSFAIAVNGGYAAGDVLIKAGDEVAIIPPVSGG